MTNPLKREGKKFLIYLGEISKNRTCKTKGMLFKITEKFATKYHSHYENVTTEIIID